MKKSLTVADLGLLAAFCEGTEASVSCMKKGITFLRALELLRESGAVPTQNTTEAAEVAAMGRTHLIGHVAELRDAAQLVLTRLEATPDEERAGDVAH